MLLNVSTALANLTTSRFSIQDTTQITSYVPMDSDGWPSQGIVVMVCALEADTLDTFTGEMVPRGTVVHAPVKLVPSGSLPGGGPTLPPLYDSDSQREEMRQMYSREVAWVLCCHDHAQLARNQQAYFYLPDVLEQICVSEQYQGSRANRLTFDPCTYGSGETALLRHPYATGLTPAQIKAADDSFIRTRGRDSWRQAALLGSANVPVTFSLARVPDFGSLVGVFKILNSPAELGAMRQRLWSAVLNLPRRRDRRLPPIAFDDTGALRPMVALDDALLPLGAPLGLCAEGAVVQSDAAWALRRDWRIRAMLSFQRDREVLLDLPLVCFTASSYRAAYINSTRPFIVMPTTVLDGVRAVGVFCLGWGHVAVWTLPPGASLPPLPDDGSGTTTLPRQFSVIQPRDQAYTSPLITSRAQLFDELAARRLIRAQVEFTMPDGQRVTLHYRTCPRGYATRWDPRVEPLIDLPAMEPQPADHITMAVPLAVATSNLATVARDLNARLRQGRCPQQDVYGGNTPLDATQNPAERERLVALRPNVAPYNTQGTDPWQWDSRSQNPLVSVPHLYTHASPGLLDELSAFQ